MSEVIAIKTLNGHPLVDTEARAKIQEIAEKVFPTPTVILEETELEGEEGFYALGTPLAAPLVDGATYEIMWSGEKYTSPALDVTADVEMGTTTFIMGSVPSGAVIPSPSPGCPFLLQLFPDGLDEDGRLMYGVVQYFEAPATPVVPVLSIKQIDGAESEESGDSGAFVAHVTMTNTAINAPEFGELDKTKAEFLAAFNAEKPMYVNTTIESDLNGTPTTTTCIGAVDAAMKTSLGESYRVRMGNSYMGSSVWYFTIAFKSDGTYIIAPNT